MQDQLHYYVSTPQPTPYSLLASLSSLFTATVSNLHPLPRLEWIERGMKLNFDGEFYSVLEIGSWIKAQRKKVEVLLEEVLLDLKLQNLPLPTLEELKDNSNASRIGESFASHPSNSTIKSLQYTLINQIITSTKFYNHFHLSNGSPNSLAFTSYIERVHELGSQLRALIHIEGGPPMRGPQEASLTIINPSDSVPRSLYITPHASIGLVSTYSKTQSRSLESKSSIHSLSTTTSNLLLAFVLLVKPLTVYLAEINGKELLAKCWKVMLWSSMRGPISSTEITNSFNQVMRSSFSNVNFNYSNWRHISIAIGRFIAEELPAELRLAYDLSDSRTDHLVHLAEVMGMDSDMSVDLIACHGSRVGKSYGRAFGDVNAKFEGDGVATSNDVQNQSNFCRLFRNHFGSFSFRFFSY